VFAQVSTTRSVCTSFNN